MSLYLQSSAARGKAAKLKTKLRGSDRIKMGGGKYRKKQITLKIILSRLSA